MLFNLILSQNELILMNLPNVPYMSRLLDYHVTCTSLEKYLPYATVSLSALFLLHLGHSPTEEWGSSRRGTLNIKY